MVVHLKLNEIERNMERNQDLRDSSDRGGISFKEFESVDTNSINPVSVGNLGDCSIQKSGEGTTHSHVTEISSCGKLNGASSSAASTLIESGKTVVGTSPHTNHQPLILGNVSAAEMISSLLRQTRMQGAGQNTSLGLLNGQLVSIVPIVVQGQPISLPLNDPVVPSKEEQIDTSNSSLMSSSSASLSLPDLTPNVNIDTVPSLSTSDTVVLNSSEYNPCSNKLSSASSTFILPNPDKYSKADFSSENSSLLSANFSAQLQNQISNRIVSLDSIPTVSIFNPAQKEMAPATSRGNEVTPLPISVPVVSNHESSTCSLGTSCVENEKHFETTVLADPKSNLPEITKPIDGAGKVVRKRRGKMAGRSKNQGTLVVRRSPRIKSGALHADRAVGEFHISNGNKAISDTDVMLEDEKNVEVEKSSLSREDTVILDSDKGIHPNISTEDTIILPSEDSRKIDQSEKLSEGFSFTSLNSINSSSPLLQSLGKSPLLPSLSSNLSFGKSFVLQQEGIPSIENQHSVVPISLITNESFAKLLESKQSISMTSSSETQAQCEPPTSKLVNVGSMSSLPSISSIFSLSQLNSQHTSTKESQSTQTDLALGNRVVPTQLLQLLSRLTTGQLSLLETLAQNTQFDVHQQQIPQTVSNLLCPPEEMPISTEVYTVVNSDRVPTHMDDDVTSNPSGTIPEASVQFPCSKCSAHFANQEELDKHQDVHKKTIKCDLCSATFARPGNYTRHRKIHNLQNMNRDMFKCEHCSREFLQRCDLKRHLLIHANKEPHRCSQCGKGYVRRSDLVVHMRFHNGDKAFKCSLCDKSFYQTGDLSRHKRRAHYPSSQLTCGHCDKKYACEATLIRHMKCVHKDIILLSVHQKLEAAKSKKEGTKSSETNNDTNLYVSMTQQPPEET